jgi:hypothetical protein
MHKKIVKAISQAIGHTDENLFKIFVNTQETDGFWGMIIEVKPKYKHLIHHIELIGLSIGRFYGEGLGVTKSNNTIKFD